MKNHVRRGVSLGTIVMLALTCLVAVGLGYVLPKLMGSADILMEDRAMRSSTNLNGALPELALKEIPIALAESGPQGTSLPENTQALPEMTPALSAQQTDAPAPAVPMAPKQGGTVSLTFGGSIVADDLIRKSGYYADSDKYDFTDNLSLIAEELDSDLTLVSVETLTDPSRNVKQIPNAPATIWDMLSIANIDVVALGYSRAYDYGSSGLQATLNQAQKRGLSVIGAYESQEDADTIRFFEIDQVKIAYLHYTRSISSTGKKQMKSAGSSYAIPAAASDSDIYAIADDIADARKQGADVVVVSLNWSGSESLSTTSSKMTRFMQSLADAGADIIVGAGTKAVREVEFLTSTSSDGSARKTLCIWSLGSLMNGERGNGNVTGMLVHVTLSHDGEALGFDSVTYTPTYIWRFKQDGQQRYRVVASDLPAPDGMDEDQADFAKRAFENLKNTLGDSPVSLRTPQ